MGIEFLGINQLGNSYETTPQQNSELSQNDSIFRNLTATESAPETSLNDIITAISRNNIPSIEDSEGKAEKQSSNNASNILDLLIFSGEITDDEGIDVEEHETGCIVTSVNSQAVESSPLELLSKDEIAAIGENGFSTTIEGSDDVIVGRMDQALSTQNVHNCACLVLYNDTTQTQMLYHVFGGTQYSDTISDVIGQVMPDGFNRAAIVPGDNLLTEGTVEMIYSALTEHYPDAEINFMHSTMENPVLVSYNGQMYQAESKPDSTLFQQGINQNPNPSPYSIESENAVVEECSK